MPPKKAKKINGYERPAVISLGTVLTDMQKNAWKVGPSIGSGGFGDIYACCSAASPTKKKADDYPHVVKIVSSPNDDDDDDRIQFMAIHHFRSLIEMDHCSSRCTSTRAIVKRMRVGPPSLSIDTF